MMETISQIKDKLFTKVGDLSVMNQLVSVVYVDSNPALVEYTEIKKEGNTIKEIKHVNQYKLKKHSLILKSNQKNSIIISDEINTETIKRDTDLYECFSLRINRSFINTIDLLSNVEISKWKYFNRNLLNRVLFRRTQNDLVHKIIEHGKDYSYVIVPESVAKSIMDSSFFEKNTNECKSIIKNIGALKIDHITLNVYLDSELKDNKLYFSKYDSVLLILNKNLNVVESKMSKNKKNITVEVEYVFIQKDSIKCLIL